MSSIHHEPLFDLNISFPKDHKWYFDTTTSQLSQDERNDKAFPVVAGSRSHYNIIRNLPFRPLTVVQGDTAWFLMRMYSLSSSTVDICISSRAREVTQGHAMRRHYEIVLEAIDRMNLLPRRSNNDDNNNANVTAGGRDGRGGRRRGQGFTFVDLDDLLNSDSESDSNEEETPSTTMDWAANWIRRVNDGKGDVFRDRLDSATMDDSTIRGIVGKNDNRKPEANISSLKKKLKAWSEQKMIPLKGKREKTRKRMYVL